MALADRIQPDAPRKTKFEQWLDSLEDRHRDLILGWGHDPRVSTSRITAAVAEDDPTDGFTGYKVSKDTVGEWRRKL